MGNSHKTRRFLWEFPIGFYVKLSSAVAAILVGGMKCRTQFWKGITQGSYQQSLVEIGSVVSKPLGQLQQNFGGMILGWPPFQNCVRRSRLPTKLKIEKRGDEILIVH
jgi:hypothetical protein